MGNLTAKKFRCGLCNKSFREPLEGMNVCRLHMALQTLKEYGLGSARSRNQIRAAIRQCLSTLDGVHRVKISRVKQEKATVYRASCSCGWKGQKSGSVYQALEEGQTVHIGYGVVG